MRLALVATALVLVLTACEEPEWGRSDTIPVHSVPFLEQHSPEVLAEAEEILGMEFVEAPIEAGGAVVLFLARSQDNGKSGAETWVHHCSPVIWSIDNPVSVAHEFGHALGLAHVDDPDNFMFETAVGTKVDEEQLDTMRTHAWYLANGCEN